MTTLLLILTAFFLVLLNAFFVAAEFGIVKLRHTRVKALQQNHGLRGRILANVHQHLDAYLSACQLGITLASIGLGWVGEPAFATLFHDFFIMIGISSLHIIKLISFMMAFALISFLHIVVGELMPKSLAIRQSEKISLWTATPLYGFYWLMYPAIWILNNCSNFLLKTFKLDAVHKGEHSFSTDEIKFILHSSHAQGELTKEETDIIAHTLDFADLKVTEVMRSRQEMISINLHDSLDKILDSISTSRFSRYPIYDEIKNQFVGILHIKDLFAALHQQKQNFLITEIMRPILKVSAKLPTLNLLKKFREGFPHFALVYSHRENLIGFVTLDNLLHVMLGRIKDEFHKTSDIWQANKDGSFTVKGECPLYLLEQILDCDIETEDEVEINTVMGLILYRLGYIPKIQEKIDFSEFSAVIEKVQGPRIQQLRLYPKPLEQAANH